MRMIAGFLGGFILAVLCAALITITVAASLEQAIILVATSFCLCWGASLASALFSKSARQAWRRLLLASSVISFLLSVAGIVFTGSLVTPIGSAGTQVAGFAIGGGSFGSFLVLTGFSVGVIFLILGLLIGRDKKLIHVQKHSSVSMSSDEKQRHEPKLND